MPSDWYTPQQVGLLVGGFTASFIREEIRAGELRAELIMSRAGKLGRYRISRLEALAYRDRLFGRHQTATGAITATGVESS